MDQPTTKCPKSMLEEFHGNYGVIMLDFKFNAWLLDFNLACALKNEKKKTSFEELDGVPVLRPRGTSMPNFFVPIV
jgi:hypothetical protein